MILTWVDLNQKSLVASNLYEQYLLNKDIHVAFLLIDRLIEFKTSEYYC